MVLMVPDWNRGADNSSTSFREKSGKNMVTGKGTCASKTERSIPFNTTYLVRHLYFMTGSHWPVGHVSSGTGNIPHIKTARQLAVGKWGGSAARLFLIYMSDSTRFGRGCILPENLATKPFIIDRKCRPRAERSHKIGKAGWLSAFYWEDMAQEFSDENRLIMHLPAENTVPLACGSHRRRAIGY